MPGNTPNSTFTNEIGTTGKRKPAARKSAAAPASKPPSRKAPSTAAAAPATQGPTEILFKDLPQHGQEPVAPFIWIDHPLENERLFHSEYVIRLGVGGAEQVEISIDKGAWIPCRFTSGYWWYDWTNIPRGKHVLAARMRTAGGQWYRTPARTIVY
jgi:hypothetical protein